MTTQSFPRDAVITVVTGILFCDIKEVYRLLYFMTADKLHTHQLPRALAACSRALMKQFPDLCSSEPPEFITNSWLEQQARRLPATFAVHPLSADEFEHKDPLQEAREMFWGQKVIPVVVEKEDRNASAN